MVYEGCIEGMTKVFGLVNEGVSYRNVVSSPLAFGKCTLEGVGYVRIFHKVHKAGVENACEEFTEATSDGNRSVVGWIVF